MGRLVLWRVISAALLAGAVGFVEQGAEARGPTDVDSVGSPIEVVNGSAEAEIMVLYAANQPDGGAGIDPNVGPLPALRKPPFSSYNTLQLLSRTRHQISKVVPAVASLPNGSAVQVTLREALPDNRYRLDASITQPGGPAFLPRLEVTTPLGEAFFVGGQSHKAGLLIIGITMVK